jgi:hypothetical protein
MKYNQQLPEAVEKDLDAYIERVKNVKWFEPDPSLTKDTVDTKVKSALSAFGITASIEYRSLKTEADYIAAWEAARDETWSAAWDKARSAAWSAARSAAWDAVWSAAWSAAWDAVWGAARSAARDAAWDAARSAVRDAVWGAADILASHTPTYKLDKPFVKMFEIWELGMYPVGVVNGVFIVYSPIDFEEDKKEHELHVVINGVIYVPKN